MRKARIAVVTGAAVLGLGFFAAPAQASPAAPLTNGGTAPACVSRHADNSFGYVDLKNNCGKTMHVNVILSGASDSGCFSMANGESVRVTYPLIGWYDKVVVCT
jgi:hypothetical protein